jgi:hypothetical protein
MPNASTKDLTGKLYRIVDAKLANAQMKAGYMQDRLKDGDLVACLHRKHAKVHIYALVDVTYPEGIDHPEGKIYPEPFWFPAEPIGVPIFWNLQPRSLEFRRLHAEFTVPFFPRELEPIPTRLEKRGPHEPIADEALQALERS